MLNKVSESINSKQTISEINEQPSSEVRPVSSINALSEAIIKINNPSSSKIRQIPQTYIERSTEHNATVTPNRTKPTKDQEKKLVECLKECTIATSCISNGTVAVLMAEKILNPSLLPLIIFREVWGLIGFGMFTNDMQNNNSTGQQTELKCASSICVASLCLSASPELCLFGSCFTLMKFCQARENQIACTNTAPQNNSEES